MERFPLYDRDQASAGMFGWAQNDLIDTIETEYNAGKPVRVIVLKARQLGISTATEGTLFNWCFLQPGTNGLVISHEAKAAAELFNMTKLFWDTWPFRSSYTLQRQTLKQLSWAETRSTLQIATARNVASGRGSTLHAVHASECAFYNDPETLFTGLFQTIPHKHGTIVVLESTANGVGNWFHKQWMAAVEGESSYVPLFFPWWKHHEYSMATTLAVRSELDADERELLKLGASFPHIAWRRWAIRDLAHGDYDKFMQEYPATPEEAFIQSGHPLFSPRYLKKCFQKERGYRGFLQSYQNGKVKFVQDPSGNLTVFRAPIQDDRHDRYFVAGDPSYTTSGDPGCIQVINRATFEQMAVWHGQTDPLQFAEDMIKVGKYYNNAMLCPEVEGGGSATIAAILAKGYDNIWFHHHHDKIRQSFNNAGWSTNGQRKEWAIGTLQHLIIDQSITIHDQRTFDQLLGYVMFDNYQYGNSDPDVHDDGVMALAIAVTATRTVGPFVERTDNNNILADMINQEETRAWLDSLQDQASGM